MVCDGTSASLSRLHILGMTCDDDYVCTTAYLLPHCISSWFWRRFVKVRSTAFTTLQPALHFLSLNLWSRAVGERSSAGTTQRLRCSPRTQQVPAFSGPCLRLHAFALSSACQFLALVQATPVPNFTLAGDWTSQKFLGSMEADCRNFTDRSNS